MTYKTKADINAVMIGNYTEDWTEFWMGELFDCDTDEDVQDCLSDFLEDIELDRELALENIREQLGYI